ILNRISFCLRTGETLGVLGESGAGKTTLGLTLMGLLPCSTWQVTGEALFGHQPLITSGRFAARPLVARVAMIHQDSGVLNPVLRVGRQITEVLRARKAGDKQSCRDLALNLLSEVGFEDSESIYLRFPHQLSGGERQRVMIAQALAYD